MIGADDALEAASVSLQPRPRDGNSLNRDSYYRDNHPCDNIALNFDGQSECLETHGAMNAEHCPAFNFTSEDPIAQRVSLVSLLP